MLSSPQVTLSSPTDVLAAVPYLIGFHPADSLVFIGLDPHGKVIITGRYDLPTNGPAIHHAMVRRLDGHGVTSLVLAGYGPPTAVTPAIDAFDHACTKLGMRIREALRVTDGRYWSYTCTDTTCCPAEGTPLPGDTSLVAVELIASGLSTATSRSDLAATLAPAGGHDAEKAEQIINDELAFLRTAGINKAIAWTDNTIAEGLRLISTHSAPGASLPNAEATAAILLALRHQEVRDHALVTIDADSASVIPLWRWLTRHAPERHIAVPATLCAWAAWRTGNGVLARIALDKALDTTPDDQLATFLDYLLTTGTAPTRLPPATSEPLTGFADTTA